MSKCKLFPLSPGKHFTAVKLINTVGNNDIAQSKSASHSSNMYVDHVKALSSDAKSSLFANSQTPNKTVTPNGNQNSSVFP